MDRQHHDQHGTATLVSTSSTPSLLSRVSWGAILAGTVIAFGTMILLAILGSAIGFRSVDPASGNAVDGLGIGAAIWWILTSIIALGIGGYVAGRLSGIPDRSSASAHGAAVWGLVTILTLWLATSAVGSVLSTATGALSGAARAAGNVANTAATAATGSNSPVEVTEQQVQNQAQEVISDVQQQVQQVDTQQVRQQAGRYAENAADAISTAAWYAFFASLLSLAAAAFAATRGAPKHTFVVGNEKVETTTGTHRTTT